MNTLKTVAAWIWIGAAAFLMGISAINIIEGNETIAYLQMILAMLFLLILRTTPKDQA